MDEKIAIHCKTKDQFIEVLKIFEKKGWKWNSGNNPLYGIDFWNRYKEKTCIEYKDEFVFAYKELYRERAWKIISFKNFLKIKKRKTKK